MNEFDLVNQARPDVPPYDPGTKAMARDQLVAAGRKRVTWRKPYTFAVAGALALAVAAATAAFLPAGTEPAPPRQNAAMPKIALMSAEQVLDRAAGAAAEELDPRDDQYVLVESQTMYTSQAFGEGGKEDRWLYRTKRKIWLRADGKRDAQGREGVLEIETLDPVAYPGWKIPKLAHDEKGSEVMPLVYCGGTGPWSKNYTALKQLPTDPEAMKAHLYKSFPATGDKQQSPEYQVWDGASELLRESYMPPAQRAALFKALGTLPGITVTEDAEDAAGRKGYGVGVVYNGERSELVIDKENYTLLGERSVVVEKKQDKAPVGSLLASTAQLSVSVSDTAPDAPVTEKEQCQPGQGG
ncbi:CU044_5270 family protein [Nonomuraea typhae]|uniref:CU044_5270 family protein n=1 Tax=Nonomuraea typhae TaxID=2603600 RepID=UPI0012FB1873|nr:CU044_5270 family protein [Nonomuraea typhae]